MKYNILVCNMKDNPKLKSDIEKYLNLNEVRYNLQELNESDNIADIFSHYSPDLVFLSDKETAVKKANSLKKMDENVAIVFITDDYSFKLENYADIFDSIIYIPLNDIDLNIFIHNSFEKMKDNLKLFMFKYENKMNITPYKDIICFEKTLMNFILHSKRGDFLIKEDMRILLANLDKRFFVRCHNNFIVNIKKIDSIENNVCIMQNSKITVPIGRRYKANIVKNMGLHRA